MAVPQKGGWSDEHDVLAREAGYESWAAWIEQIEEQRGHEICGGRNRRDQPCTRHRVSGNPRGRCRTHGGGSKLTQRDGRYGNRLDEASEKIYKAERDDPAQLGNTDEIAVATMRIGELLEQVHDERPSAEELEEAAKALHEASAQVPDPTVAEQIELLGDRLLEFRDKANAANDLWGSVGEWIERRADLVDAQRKLLEARHRAVPTDMVRAIIDYLGSGALKAIEQHVDNDQDREAALRAFREHLDRLRRGKVGGRDVSPIEPDGAPIPPTAE